MEIDTTQMLEKTDLVAALQEKQTQALPLNPHLLQPPLHNITARGDILVMKVAESKEDDESEDDGESPELELLSNEEFFLDYSKAEYLEFASKKIDPEPATEKAQGEDVEAADGADDDSGGDGEEDGDEEEDEDYDPEENEEMDKTALLNIILSGVIQKFREDKGRGPNTEELLNLRSAVAAELDVKISSIPDENDEETSNGKRPVHENEDDTNEKATKRVKFVTEQEKSDENHSESGAEENEVVNDSGLPSKSVAADS